MVKNTELCAREKAIMKPYYSAQRKISKAIEAYEVELRNTRDELQKLLFDMRGTDLSELDKQAVAIEYGKVNNMINNLSAIKTLVNPL